MHSEHDGLLSLRLSEYTPKSGLARLPVVDAEVRYHDCMSLIIIKVQSGRYRYGICALAYE